MLKELRALSEDAKKKIIVVSTFIIMAIILYLWLGYFNGLMIGVAQRSDVKNQNLTMQDTAQKNPEPKNFELKIDGNGGFPGNILGNAQKALSSFTDGFIAAAQWVIEVLQSPMKYTVSSK